MAVVSHALLGWRVDGEFHQCRSMLSDISLGGCMAIAEEMPPDFTAVVLCLDGAILPVWYEAQVLESRKIGLHTWKLRLSFPESCPYPLYMAVAYGIANRDSGEQVELPRYQAASAKAAASPCPRVEKGYRFWDRG